MAPKPNLVLIIFLFVAVLLVAGYLWSAHHAENEARRIDREIDLIADKAAASPEQYEAILNELDAELARVQSLRKAKPFWLRWFGVGVQQRQEDHVNARRNTAADNFAKAL